MANRPTNVLTDAEFAAEMAARALTEGRYELGRALASLAAAAARSQAQALPAAGIVTVPIPRDNPPQENPQVPTSARCGAEVHRDGVRDFCRAVILDNNGEWAHLDPVLDVDHEATISTSANY